MLAFVVKRLLQVIPLLFVIMTAIVYYKHRANISRLIAGSESRIGASE